MNAISMPHVPPPWRGVLPPLVALLLLVLYVYRDTALSMVAIWERSDTFAHAFLVPPISAWLIWRQRERLLAAVPRPSAWVLALSIGVGIVWLLGELGAANSVMQLAFMALLVLAVAALVGMDAARMMLFPLGFLFFAVPIGEFVMPQLMIWTADFTALALRVSGIPIYREGLQLVIPTGTWHIIEACSGVRYLMASMMVGTLFAYLHFQSLRRRLIFVGVSILVPIVANWFRAYFIVLLGHVSENRLALGVDHLIYGWVFFGVVILLMFLIGARFSEPVSAVEQPRAAATDPAVGRDTASIGKAWAVAAAAAVFAIAPHLVVRALDARDVPVAVQLELPTQLNDGWHLTQSAVADWTPRFHNPSAELSGTYASQGRQVGLYIGYYRDQSGERKLVSSQNMLVGSADVRWRASSEATTVVMVGDAPIAFRAASLRDNGAPQSSADDGILVWQVYWVNGRLTVSDPWAKFYAAFDKLMGRGDDAAVIIAFVRRDAGSAQAALESFVRANVGAIGARLSAARDQGRE